MYIQIIIIVVTVIKLYCIVIYTMWRCKLIIQPKHIDPYANQFLFSTDQSNMNHMSNTCLPISIMVGMSGKGNTTLPRSWPAFCQSTKEEQEPSWNTCGDGGHMCSVFDVHVVVVSVCVYDSMTVCTLCLSAFCGRVRFSTCLGEYKELLKVWYTWGAMLLGLQDPENPMV